VLLFTALLAWNCPRAEDPAARLRQSHAAVEDRIRGEEHYAMRDGLRIYLWEKRTEGSQGAFSMSGKVVLLVHGGTWSGHPDFDLQVRDYSIMDFLAKNGYDVWAVDIHGYSHSDKNNPLGARASANLFSLVNGLEPYAYLNYIFENLPAADTVEAHEALLPWNVKPLLKTP
jgi:pimeloyl-ACP methyl ester carboxylesterase